MNQSIMENAPKIPTMEEKIDTAIESILSGYPETASLPEEFRTELGQLKEKINALKEGTYTQEGATPITYNEHTNTVYVPGEKTKTSIGELASGMEWGKSFNVDKSAFQSKKIAREMYEAYVLAFVKHETLSLLDGYILEKEINYYKERQNISTQKAYEGIKETRDTNPLELKQAGVLAEKMVQSLLIRLSVDNPNIGFEIVNINAFQDVNLKIDFIIKIKSIEKGVKVESVKNIQFTIAKGGQKMDIKEDQMKKFKDVILVQMPELQVTETFNKWKSEKKITAGPDKLFDKATEQAIVTEILK